MMPPSPASRCSPGRKHIMESTHKRGRSFEGSAILRDKDDDLILFSNMQNKEMDNLLLHDDVNDSLSKLNYLPYNKLDVTIPTRAEKSDLLNIEGEKNDYDWLLTPPDTPLFRSLDDDGNEPQHVLLRGRPRSQPVKVLRSSLSMTESSNRMNRSSASPRRSSPSPRSSTSITQLKARPSSARRASPPLVLLPATTSQRPSTPNKPSSPTPRSSTPTARRMSTGSSGPASSSGRRPASPSERRSASPFGRRPASPMDSSRGNSASPKLRGWQADFPGFSLEAPPNLRTSLSDRPVPHMRGMSPTSRSGRGRQSMSPTASRSTGSSRSHERDHIISFNKGSIASSGDDDVDSLQSVAISISPPVRRNGASVNNRPVAHSNKSSRTLSGGSVPKRYFDSVLRQTENKKTPPNMFRPLLSSVPASTFYVGKANGSYRPIFSRNSSLTTSTSASSDQGASVAPDIEVSELDQNDLPGDWERTKNPSPHEEMFIFDKDDDMLENVGHEEFVGLPISSGSFTTSKINSQECSSMLNSSETRSSIMAQELPRAPSYSVVADGCEIMSICSKCGQRFQVLMLNGDRDICEDCTKVDQLLSVQLINSDSEIALDEEVGNEMQASELFELPEESSRELFELPEKSSEEDKNKLNIQQMPSCQEGSCPLYLVAKQDDLYLQDYQFENKEKIVESDNESKFEQISHRSRRNDDSEGRGLPVLLLQRPSNRKRSVIQGRTFSTTIVPWSEPSYVRDDSNSLRHRGQDPASASSSMDLGSSGQSEDRIQHQSNSTKNETWSTSSDADGKVQSSGTDPELPVGTYEPLFHPDTETEINYNGSSMSVKYEGLKELVKDTVEQDNSFDRVHMSAKRTSSIGLDHTDDSLPVRSCMTANTCKPLLPHVLESAQDHSATDFSVDEPGYSFKNADEDPLKANEASKRHRNDAEAPDDSLYISIIEQQYVTNDLACRSDTSDAATDSHSDVILESHGVDSFEDRQTESECMPSQIQDTAEEVPNRHVSTKSENGVSDCTSESCFVDHVPDIQEEPTVSLEVPKGRASKSLTLAEATDSILFCSSIVHDIAYKAASIAVDKELQTQTPPEPSRPSVMFIGNSVPEQKDARIMPTKRIVKPDKPKRKKSETQTKLQSTQPAENTTSEVPAASNARIPCKVSESAKPPKLESKCNCTVM